MYEVRVSTPLTGQNSGRRFPHIAFLYAKKGVRNTARAAPWEQSTRLREGRAGVVCNTDPPGLSVVFGLII